MCYVLSPLNYNKRATIYHPNLNNEISSFFDVILESQDVIIEIAQRKVHYTVIVCISRMV